jgi:hypothetical protein
MCQTITIDGALIEDLAELRTAWIDPIFHDGMASPMPGDNCCLCPVDITALAARYGWVEIDHDDDPMDRRFRRA